MNLDLDGGKVLYALGVVFALGALVYFARDVVFGLSITVTAALLFAAFLAFLVAGVTLDRDVLDVVAYAVAALSYAVFLWYVASRYALDETGVFLLLAGSAVLFVGLGYAVREKRLDVDRRTAGYVVVGLLAVSLVLVGADVLTGDVRYSADLDEETTVEVTEEMAAQDRTRATPAVGTLTVANPSPFTRPTDLPDAHACVLGTDAPTDPTPVRYDPQGFSAPDTIGGGDERTHGVEVNVPVVTNETGPVTYEVERGADCDVTRDDPTLIVVFDDEVGTA